VNAETDLEQLVGPGMVRLLTANRRKQVAAAERDAQLARVILESGVDMPGRWRQVAEARASMTGASWAEVGASVGLSKDAAISYFRRLRERAGQ
jgi:hypothetical protein